MFVAEQVHSTRPRDTTFNIENAALLEVKEFVSKTVQHDHSAGPFSATQTLVAVAKPLHF